MKTSQRESSRGLPFVGPLDSIDSAIEFYLHNRERPDWDVGLTITDQAKAFIADCKTWLQLPQAQRDKPNLQTMIGYVNRFISQVKTVVSLLTEHSWLENDIDIFYIHQLIGEEIPWQLLSEQACWEHFSEIFKHKQFRLHFIKHCFFMMEVLRAEVLADPQKSSLYFSFNKDCNKSVVAFLKGDLDVLNYLKQFPSNKGFISVDEFKALDALPLNDDSDFTDSQKTTLLLEGWATKSNTPSASLQIDYPTEDALQRPQERYEPLCLAGATPLDYGKEPLPKKTTTTASREIDRAMSNVHAAATRIRDGAPLDINESRDLHDAMEAVNSAHRSPSRISVQELKAHGERFQSKSSPFWKALSLALLGLALTIAGALTIAVSAGAISTGFFAPPGFLGTVAGIALIETGVASLTTAGVTLCESLAPETQLIMR